MSKDAIQTVLRELEALPETDQGRVLDFLSKLKRPDPSSEAGVPMVEEKSALAIKEGLMIFTGKLDAPDVDWVAVTRDERDAELMQAAFGETRRG